MDYREWEKRYYRQECDFEKASEKLGKIFAIFLAIAFIGITSFLPFSFIFWIICQCFEFSFTWKMSFGAWLIFKMVQFAFKRKN